MELLVIPESSNRLAMLSTGDVDIAFALSAAELSRAEQAEREGPFYTGPAKT